MLELSVIIPTRNRAIYLERALESITGQTFPLNRFEIIVVDNGSSDTTREVAAGYATKFAGIRYLRENKPGLHNARHAGMREAQSEFLVYVDDDIEAFPGWLEGVWQGFARHNAVLVGGKNLPKWERDPPAWLRQLWSAGDQETRSLGYLSILDFGNREKDIDPSSVWGCNFSIRKSVLLEAGGFHPDSMPDNLLHLRGDGESYVARYVGSKGYKTVYMPSACVYHLVPKSRMTLEYFRKRAFSQGVSDSYTILRSNSAEPGKRSKRHPLSVFVSLALSRKLLWYILPSATNIRANMDNAYWQGFNWHRQLYLKDDRVRNWVLRENYLDIV